VVNIGHDERIFFGFTQSDNYYYESVILPYSSTNTTAYRFSKFLFYNSTNVLLDSYKLNGQPTCILESSLNDLVTFIGGSYNNLLFLSFFFLNS
jgi:hypothetical protein